MIGALRPKADAGPACSRDGYFGCFCGTFSPPVADHSTHLTLRTNIPTSHCRDPAVAERPYRIASRMMSAVRARLGGAAPRLLALDRTMQAENKAGETFREWEPRDEVVNAATAAGGAQNFPDAASFKNSYMADVGINDRRKSWHSFRHTFKTSLTRAGVSRAIQDDLCGHSDYSAGAAYIHETSVEAMKHAIDQLHFDGFPMALSTTTPASQN